MLLVVFLVIESSYVCGTDTFLVVCRGDNTATSLGLSDGEDAVKKGDFAFVDRKNFTRSPVATILNTMQTKVSRALYPTVARFPSTVWHITSIQLPPADKHFPNELEILQQFEPPQSCNRHNC